MTKFRTWTPEDTDIARQMFVNEEPSAAFLAKLGRSETAAREHIKRVDVRAKTVARSTVSKIPAGVIEDAARRATTPRSLTARAFGDPPLFASALGKKIAADSQHGIAEASL
jgi:hypothetical protein